MKKSKDKKVLWEVSVSYGSDTALRSITVLLIRTFRHDFNEAAAAATKFIKRRFFTRQHCNPIIEKLDCTGEIDV